MALVLLLGFYYAYSHNNYNPLTWKLPVFNKSIQSTVLPNSMDTATTEMLIDTMSMPVEQNMNSTDMYNTPPEVIIDSTAAATDGYGPGE